MLGPDALMLNHQNRGLAMKYPAIQSCRPLGPVSMSHVCRFYCAVFFFSILWDLAAPSGFFKNVSKPWQSSCSLRLRGMAGRIQKLKLQKTFAQRSLFIHHLSRMEHAVKGLAFFAKRIHMQNTFRQLVTCRGRNHE